MRSCAASASFDSASAIHASSVTWIVGRAWPRRFSSMMSARCQAVAHSMVMPIPDRPPLSEMSRTTTGALEPDLRAGRAVEHAAQLTANEFVEAVRQLAAVRAQLPRPDALRAGHGLGRGEQQPHDVRQRRLPGDRVGFRGLQGLAS